MRLCTIEGCGGKHTAKGFCYKHYHRLRAHGSPYICLKQRNNKCSVEGCDKIHEGHGFCNTHNSRRKRHGDAYKKFARSMTVAERLLANVNTTEPGFCWDWLKHKNKQGYGNIGIKNKTLMAHRVSYETFIGEIPKGMLICHHCDRPSCINPSHLFLGSHKDNSDDKIKKGRENLPRGENHWHIHGKTKLCVDDVMKIKEKLKEGLSTHKIALEFNVSAANISGIKREKHWRHVNV